MIGVGPFSEIKSEFLVRDATSKSIERDVLFRSEGKGGEGKSDSSGPTNNRVSGPHCVLGVLLV